MGEKIVSVENLYFSYGKNKVLENVNFDIEKGDFVGIIGPNGSAKSTLMKLMIGILKLEKGNIKLFSTDIDKFKDFHRIGYISQNVREFNTKFPATVEEIVGANLYKKMGFFKIGNKKIYENVHKALEVVEMEDYSDRLIGNLSGGQKQRIFIARALVSNPEILFMDEPLVGVDIESQNRFYDLMEKLNMKYNITLVMVSHDIGVISKKVNKILCLGNGKFYVHDSKNVELSHVMGEIYGKNMDILDHDH
ncbi:MAG: Zinc ABC transporter ATP-binding protein ZurA [Sporanaerobacter sp.]|jgi:zinc transport system ATP-binding protein|uniref:metal ABC transporter ATP-binding protein n=1 Tax=Sporanaerobacter sp. TaxID=2010183 RepID=UPI003A1022A8